MAVKIIDTSSREIKTSSKNPSSPKTNRFRLILKSALFTFLATLGLLLVLSLLAGLAVYPQVNSITKQVEKNYLVAKKVEAALNEKDIKLAEKELENLEVETKQTRKVYQKISFLRFFPIVTSYYNDGLRLLNIADTAVGLGEKTLEAIDPFADILGFKGADSNITAEKKAEVVVKEVVPKLIPLVEEIEENLTKVNSELTKIDPGRYPANFSVKGVKVREALLTAKKEIKAAQKLIPEFKPLLQAAPEIAGEPVEKVYLILLQNDKELRATGGFITAYALARVKGGQLVEIESDDIYQLDLKYRRTEKSPEAIQKYIGHNSLPIRDSNYSPDFLLSANRFESMYNTIPNLPKISGIIALDTEFVRTFLEATGPIKTKKTKETWSAEKNRLGIPDVVYKLELYAEKINRHRPDRKGVIGELMDALIDKLLNAKPDEIPKYLETFVDTVSRKHILFYFHNSVAQSFAEKYNAAGRIKEYKDDYFHLNNSNFGGLKGNLYLKQEVLQDIRIEADGTVVKNVTVTLRNTARADGWLNSIYLNWMRLYVPVGSKLISKKVYRDFTSGVELGKEVYRGYGPTYPLNSSTANFVYQLPFKIRPNEGYKMLIQKQPGVENLKMTIKINGQLREEFDLKSDRELLLRV